LSEIEFVFRLTRLINGWVTRRGPTGCVHATGGCLSLPASPVGSIRAEQAVVGQNEKTIRGKSLHCCRHGASVLGRAHIQVPKIPSAHRHCAQTPAYPCSQQVVFLWFKLVECRTGLGWWFSWWSVLSSGALHKMRKEVTKAGKMVSSDDTFRK